MGPEAEALGLRFRVQRLGGVGVQGRGFGLVSLSCTGSLLHKTRLVLCLILAIPSRPTKDD